MTTSEKKAIKLIAEQSMLPESAVNPDSRFFEDLGFDSLDTIELAIYLEDALDVRMNDDKLEKFKTVRELTEYIEELLKQPVAA